MITAYNLEIYDVLCSWLLECCKFGAFFGILGYCIKMIINAFSGKVDFF